MLRPRALLYARGVASEKAIEKRIVSALRKRGAWVVKFHGTAATRTGVPDLLCCYSGHFLAIEVKQSGGRPTTKLQEHELQQVKDAGGLAIVAMDVEVVEEALNYLDRLDVNDMVADF